MMYVIRYDTRYYLKFCFYFCLQIFKWIRGYAFFSISVRIQAYLVAFHLTTSYLFTNYIHDTRKFASLLAAFFKQVNVKSFFFFCYHITKARLGNVLSYSQNLWIQVKIYLTGDMFDYCFYYEREDFEHLKCLISRSN